MTMPSLDDLRLFGVVAQERSFTRAAARLGLRQSAVSRTISSLEQQLGARLLARTTRSVSLTEAGEQLLTGVGPSLASIDDSVTQFLSQRGEVTGTVRITAVRHAVEAVLRPVLPLFLSRYPKVSVEIEIEDGFRDLVAGRFDAGLRLGGLIEKDMVSLRVGPDLKMAVVASPAYVEEHGAPRTPRDLLIHRCINYRTTTGAQLYWWQFESDGAITEVLVPGALICNDGPMITEAALDGLGIAYTFRDWIEDHIQAGRLVSLLEKVCPVRPGYHVYYPSRRNMPPALKHLLAFLRQSYKWPDEIASGTDTNSSSGGSPR